MTYTSVWALFLKKCLDSLDFSPQAKEVITPRFRACPCPSVVGISPTKENPSVVSLSLQIRHNHSQCLSIFALIKIFFFRKNPHFIRLIISWIKLTQTCVTQLCVTQTCVIQKKVVPLQRIFKHKSYEITTKRTAKALRFWSSDWR